jgi:hypothetical protein
MGDRVSEGDRSPGPPQHPAAASNHAAEIDVERLAEKVYSLMVKELRLERARGAGCAGRRMQG